MTFSTEPLHKDPKISALLEAKKCWDKTNYKPTPNQITELTAVREIGYDGIWFWHQEG